MKDVILVTLVDIAEIEPAALEAEEAFEPGITLLVGGMLVSGHIVGKKKYMEHGPIVAQMQRIYDEHKDEIPESKEPLSPDFIHLRDAKCFTPTGRPIPADGGTFWRISLESVHGFHFGVLVPQKAEE